MALGGVSPDCMTRCRPPRFELKHCDIGGESASCCAADTTPPNVLVSWRGLYACTERSKVVIHSSLAVKIRFSLSLTPSYVCRMWPMSNSVEKVTSVPAQWNSSCFTFTGCEFSHNLSSQLLSSSSSPGWILGIRVLRSAQSNHLSPDS